MNVLFIFFQSVSLLEECHLNRKTDLLKRNVKYMIYETNCNLDPGTTKQMINFMDEHNRCRKKILRALRKRNSLFFPFICNFQKLKS